MSAHLGLAATAFVDGELSHDRRDEVLAHLAHCGACRAEVALQRQMKQFLRGGPDIPGDLSSRLRQPLPGPAPVNRPQHHPNRARKHATRGALLALGLGGALSLAGPPPPGPGARVDPTTEQFVIEHATTTGEVPFSGPEVISVSSADLVR
jgi:anti-sigma factor RsiW